MVSLFNFFGGIIHDIISTNIEIKNQKKSFFYNDFSIFFFEIKGQKFYIIYKKIHLFDNLFY